jgi:hypothetical protein
MGQPHVLPAHIAPADEEYIRGMSLKFASDVTGKSLIAPLS